MIWFFVLPCCVLIAFGFYLIGCAAWRMVDKETEL